MHVGDRGESPSGPYRVPIKNPNVHRGLNPYLLLFPGMNQIELRATAVNHIVANPSNFLGFTNGTVNHYIDEILQNGAWTDNPIMQAMVDSLGIRIHVYLANGATVLLTPALACTAPNGAICTAKIAYVDLHYLSIEPIIPQDGVDEEIPEILESLSAGVEEYSSSLANSSNFLA